jgi:hypothetical protein
MGPLTMRLWAVPNRSGNFRSRWSACVCKVCAGDGLITATMGGDLEGVAPVLGLTRVKLGQHIHGGPGRESRTRTPNPAASRWDVNR